MPSQSYDGPSRESPIKTAMRDDFRYFNPANSAVERANYLGYKAFNQSPKEKEASKKHYERNLKNLQKNAPKLAAGLAKGKKRAIAKFVGSLLSQVDWTVDWLFILLGSFALLKDIFDIAFAALGAVPVVGIAGAAIGIIVSFVGDLMFLILVVTVLVLVGGSLKNRGMAKYFIGIAMEFIAEALPGISWLPWTAVYVFILYLCVLYDRAYGIAGQNEPAKQVEQPEQAIA
jgi:hypothetical protein